MGAPEGSLTLGLAEPPGSHRLKMPLARGLVVEPSTSKQEFRDPLKGNYRVSGLYQ